MSVTISTQKWNSVCLYIQLFVGGHMFYLRYLCLLAYSGVQHILRCVFVLFFFVLCTLCCQILWIVLFWLPLRYSLTFIYDVELNIHLTISSFTSYVFVSKHILASGIPLKANSSNSFNNVCNTKQIIYNHNSEWLLLFNPKRTIVQLYQGTCCICTLLNIYIDIKTGLKSHAIIWLTPPNKGMLGVVVGEGCGGSGNTEEKMWTCIYI